MDYQVKEFSELSTKELLEIMKLRISVFVVEQNCPYQEVDEWDEIAVHIWLTDRENIIGYTRIIDKTDSLTFGRVLIRKEYRKKNLGAQLLKITLAEIQKRYPNRSIDISAQAHLRSFYQQAGFKTVSSEYLEDNIPHIAMKLEK